MIPLRLAIRGLEISLRSRGHRVPVLHGIDLSVAPGEIHCVAGESGSGKTVTCRGALRLLGTPPFHYDAGEVLLDGRDLQRLSGRELRNVWGRRVGLVFQEPGTALNPSLTVETQLGEHISRHLGLSPSAVRTRSLELLRGVELTNPELLLRRYPHELSGGMQQRLGIAVAAACGPDLLVADEPTSSLDVLIQDQILKLFLEVRRKQQLSILFVTHDLGVVERIADRVSILYAGRIVESAPREAIFGRPLHPYTALLLAAVPRPGHPGRRLATIPGTPPLPEAVPGGCPFHTRCPMAKEVCRRELPVLEGKPGSGEAHRVACHFPGSLQVSGDPGNSQGADG
ncbi:MAG: ABC transporter ATP-binding protein [Spirochaetota bacterium]